MHKITTLVRSLVDSGTLDDMDERLILADYLQDEGKEEEAIALRDPAIESFWMAGERLCWGEVSRWALIFQCPKSQDKYISTPHKTLGIPWNVMYATFGEQGFNHPQQCTSVNMDELTTYRRKDKFYLMSMQDCFDPLYAVVRAFDEGEAEDYFTENLTWAHIEEPDLADYMTDQDSVYYSPSGFPCDLEALYMAEVKLVDAILLSKLQGEVN